MVRFHLNECILEADINDEGCPVAWMISSNATEVTIDYFLAMLRERNPDVIPAKMMSDTPQAWVNICGAKTETKSG